MDVVLQQSSVSEEELLMAWLVVVKLFLSITNWMGLEQVVWQRWQQTIPNKILTWRVAVGGVMPDDEGCEPPIGEPPLNFPCSPAKRTSLPDSWKMLPETNWSRELGMPLWATGQEQGQGGSGGGGNNGGARSCGLTSTQLHRAAQWPCLTEGWGGGTSRFTIQCRFSKLSQISIEAAVLQARLTTARPTSPSSRSSSAAWARPLRLPPHFRGGVSAPGASRRR
ncbi:hypothetical protein Ocin01_12481 [Orchesella cincta]|uniref:Uncharacterized protein n=1 Tax=Orchesella cincta TaxID=48709 RepID=A0A1D2MME2_ORCCI|nr:hypothetical protein Ocin01_12481 [Orchesella cincta]